MKVQLPLLGKAAGSSGRTIYQSYWGNTYTRSFPFSFHYPDTNSQQTTQAKFFDIQRIWLPIYKELTNSISHMQRVNKNPFNTLTSFVYRIFNPYGKVTYRFPPRFFGLDPKNRIRPNIAEPILHIDDREVTFLFDNNRPWYDMSFDAELLHVILFNVDRQSMYYKNKPFHSMGYVVKFENTNEWKPEDTVYMYIALSDKNWLGNFNIVKP